MKRSFNIKPFDPADSLEVWIQKSADILQSENKLKPEDVVTYIDQVKNTLRQRGYTDQDFSQSMRVHFKFCRYLILNVLLESLCLAGIEYETAVALLTSLDQENEQQNSDPREPINPLAHVMWIGPFTHNQSELIGIKSLSVVAPAQDIRFWVLDEYVDHYKNALKDCKNITVVSVEAFF